MLDLMSILEQILRMFMKTKPRVIQIKILNFNREGLFIEDVHFTLSNMKGKVI